MDIHIHGKPALTACDIDALIDKSDRKLFRQATQPGHCLHHLLLKHPLTVPISFANIRICLLPTVQYSQFIAIVVYLNMHDPHNPLIVIFRAVN